MSYDGKQFLDMTGLTAYDTAIKNYIDTEDAKSIKFAKLDSTGNNLLLYKSASANAQSLDSAADFTIAMGSAALKNFVKSLGSAMGATLDETNDTYSVSFTGTDLSTYTNAVAALKGLDSKVGTLGSLTTTEKGSIVGAINEVVSAIAALDVSEFALASESNGVVTIKGIKEADGKIAVGTDSSNDVVLNKVATTGAADDVSTTAITDGAAEDPTTLYSAGTVQGTLQSIARDLNDASTASVVTVEKQGTAESGYASTYVIKQGGTQVGAKINIPLDYLVKSATISTVTATDKASGGKFEDDSDYAVGDKYIDFTVNAKEGTGTESHIYILIKDLIHPLSGGTTTVSNEYELQVSVSATNQITATLNNIYAQKVGYTPSSNTTVLTSVSTVKDGLDAVDTLIQGMDAVADSTKTAIDGSTARTASNTDGVFALQSITETDGKITGMTAVEVDAAGSANAVYSAITAISTEDIASLFSSGS